MLRLPSISARLCLPAPGDVLARQSMSWESCLRNRVIRKFSGVFSTKILLELSQKECQVARSLPPFRGQQIRGLCAVHLRVETTSA